MRYLRRKPGHVDVPLLPRRLDGVEPAAVAALPEYAVAYLAAARVMLSWPQLCVLAEKVFGLQVLPKVLEVAVNQWMVKHVAADAHDTIEKLARKVNR